MTNEKATIRAIVEVSSNVSGGCEFCHFATPHMFDVPMMVNHYLQEHGFELLHVGQQTQRAEEGLYHSTVAVLGAAEPPPPRQLSTIHLPPKDPE